MHLDERWSFRFDNGKKRAGLCNYTAREISVSRYIAAKASDDDIHQTLLHEVAHAMAGHAAGHGSTWKRVAESIGCDPSRTHSLETPEDLAPWLGRCPEGHEHVRWRAPASGREYRCLKCPPGAAREGTIAWQRRERARGARQDALAEIEW